MSNIVIIGSGPAGVSAALYAVRAGVQTTVLTKGSGALARAEKIENYYGFAQPVSGQELERRSIENARRLGVQFVQTEAVGLTWTDRLTVETLAGAYPADAVILATGASRAVPRIPGLTGLEGHGVSWCAACDAFFYRGKDVAVLGSGEYALHEVQALLPVVKSVTLLTNGAALTADFPPEVSVCTQKVEAILGEQAVTGVQLADGTPLAGFTAAEDGTVTLPAATLQALAAGDYTLYVTYAPLDVAYNARYEASEAPAMTSVALSVQKAEGSVAILDDVSRDYNGQPVETPAITSLGTGALTVEYRAQGGEFTTQAPKAVGSYTVRVTAAADDDYASASAQRNFRITAKRVTIDGVTVEPSKTYDGTTDATIVTGGTLSANFDGNDLRIVTGSAAYDGKNVGTGKTVSFSGFSLEGDAAENYTLASQPAGTTADITVRPVTVEDLHIQDKLYDGTDRAEYDGEPTLGNAVSGDHVALVKGAPSFTSIRTAEDIAIRFTEFSLTGADAGNYALTQPTGITASILPYALTGGEYAVNSNDWINHDFVVTAAEGYLLSLTDTADGVWQQTLRAADETAEGRLTFYVKDLATGAISLQVTEQYRIDRTQPTGEIRVDERTAWQSFLSRITFDLFYREEQTVVITSADETSGVAATEYLLSAEDLDIPALEQETFLPYEKALALAPDGEYVVYARITDRAGNVTCLRSDGMVLDATAPAITGAENGGVYCAAVTLTITDAYPVTVTVNGTPVELTENRLVLRPAEGTQLVTATDPAGNESRLEITVNDGHTWGDWSSNGDDTHTRTCTISGCGALETESCTGGEATCVDRAVCEVCGGEDDAVDMHGLRVFDEGCQIHVLAEWRDGPVRGDVAEDDGVLQVGDADCPGCGHYADGGGEGA